MVVELAIGVLAFITASAIAAFVILRTPKPTISKELELVEKEIEEWLRNPTTPSEAEPTNAESRRWAHLEPKFEWFKDKAGKFRFRLKAPNGEIIATGEAYNSKDGCVNGIESVKKNAPIAKIVEAKS
jgi:hypothetical protein